MRAPKIPLTQERLKSQVNYDPETGIFTRLVSNNRNIHVGDVAGSKKSNGYIEIQIDGVRYSAHRLAILYMTGAAPVNDVDHANRIKSDNRYANLREATRSQNCSNTEIRKANTSGFKCVYFHKKHKKFVSQCTVNGKKTQIGTFDNAEDASKAYRKFASQAQGQFFRG